MSAGKGREELTSCCSANSDGSAVKQEEPMEGDLGDEYESLGVDPKENLKLQPKKGILKATSSFDNERKLSFNREARFDEMNILATFHPADKDYGHMKIEEPKTPYHHHSDSETEEGTSECVRRVSLSEPITIDPKVLEEKIMKKRQRSQEPDADEDDQDELESEERVARRKAFESKRKQHYNEFQAVKLAKQLIEEEDKDSSHDEDSIAKG